MVVPLGVEAVFTRPTSPDGPAEDEVAATVVVESFVKGAPPRSAFRLSEFGILEQSDIDRNGARTGGAALAAAGVAAYRRRRRLASSAANGPGPATGPGPGSPSRP